MACFTGIDIPHRSGFSGMSARYYGAFVAIFQFDLFAHTDKGINKKR
jgi:hypothetical protein